MNPEELVQQSKSRFFLILLTTPKGELLSWTEVGFHNTEMPPSDGRLNMQPFRREVVIDQYYRALKESKHHGVNPQIVELANL